MKENKIEEMQSALDAAYTIIENLRKSNDEQDWKYTKQRMKEQGRRWQKNIRR